MQTIKEKFEEEEIYYEATLFMFVSFNEVSQSINLQTTRHNFNPFKRKGERVS